MALGLRELGWRAVAALGLAGGFLLPATAHAQAGLPDPAFHSPEADGLAFSMAVQADGKILVGGLFSEIDGHLFERLARLNADGTVDEGFHPRVRETRFTDDNGAKLLVYSVDVIRVQPNGQILIGGEFYKVNEQHNHSLARLNPGGSLDSSFRSPFQIYDTNLTTQTYRLVSDIALQNDGKILVAGAFAKEGVVPTEGPLMRLNSNGVRDSAFQAPDILPVGLYTRVKALPDGKILVTATQDDLANSQPILYRLNADGSKDDTFHAYVPPVSRAFTALAVQEDGKILMSVAEPIEGGDGARPRVMRFHADGSIDTGFAGVAVDCQEIVRLFPLRSGAIIVVGEIYTVAGQNDQSPETRPGIFRLHADGTLDRSFDFGEQTRPLYDGAPSVVVPWIYDIAEQTDGSLIAAGGLDLGDSRSQVVFRLRPDDPDAPPHTPRDFVVASDQPGKPRASWQRVGGSGLAYLVERRVTGLSSWETVADSPTNTFIDQSLDRGATNVQYRLVAKEGARTSAAVTTTLIRPNIPYFYIQGAEARSVEMYLPSLPSTQIRTLERRIVGQADWIDVTDTFTAPAPGAYYHQDRTVTPQTTYEYRGYVYGLPAGFPVDSNAQAYSDYRYEPVITTWSLFQEWLNGTGLGIGTDPQSDPQRTGLPLLMRYALGMEGAGLDRAKLPVLAYAASQAGAEAVTLTYRRAHEELTYIVETSTDLVTWTADGVDQGGPGPDITASAPVDGAARRFLRLRVVQPL